MKKKPTDIRVTPQRSAIMEILKSSKGHPSAEDIYKKIRRKHPNVSFKTVYNTLDLLTKREEIQELVIDRKKKRYCPDPRPHHHISCTDCGNIVDVFWDVSINLPEEKKEGYLIKGNSLTFYGICPACAGKTEAAGRPVE